MPLLFPFIMYTPEDILPEGGTLVVKSKPDFLETRFLDLSRASFMATKVWRCLVRGLSVNELARTAEVQGTWANDGLWLLRKLPLLAKPPITGKDSLKRPLLLVEFPNLRLLVLVKFETLDIMLLEDEGRPAGGSMRCLCAASMLDEDEVSKKEFPPSNSWPEYWDRSSLKLMLLTDCLWPEVIL